MPYCVCLCAVLGCGVVRLAAISPCRRARRQQHPAKRLRSRSAGVHSSENSARRPIHTRGAPRPHAPLSGCCSWFPGREWPRCYPSGALRHQRGRGAGCRRQAAARRNAGNHGNSAAAPPRRAAHAATNATLGAGRRRCTARGRARRPPVAPRRTVLTPTARALAGGGSARRGGAGAAAGDRDPRGRRAAGLRVGRHLLSASDHCLSPPLFFFQTRLRRRALARRAAARTLV